MGRKRLPAYSELLIEDIAAEGKSIARKDDLVIFVKGAVPGDVVDLQGNCTFANPAFAQLFDYSTVSKWWRRNEKI